MTFVCFTCITQNDLNILQSHNSENKLEISWLHEIFHFPLTVYNITNTFSFVACVLRIGHHFRSRGRGWCLYVLLWSIHIQGRQQFSYFVSEFCLPPVFGCPGRTVQASDWLWVSKAVVWYDENVRRGKLWKQNKEWPPGVVNSYTFLLGDSWVTKWLNDMP